MLWAIDVGNSHTVIGVWDADRWRATWRIQTDAHQTEDELAAKIESLCKLVELPFSASAVIIGSVVPAFNDALERLAREWWHIEPVVLRDGPSVGLDVHYEPPHAVGPDRIANALGALARFSPPMVVVDFGTATTFDAIDAGGAYLGGAILPGPRMALEALFARTARLPQVEFKLPPNAIGRNTTHAIQSGVVRGYVGAIEAIAEQMRVELGGGMVIATGGLGTMMQELCPVINVVDEWLTLDGLRIAHSRLTARAT